MDNRGVLVTALVTVAGIIALALITYGITYHSAYSGQRSSTNTIAIASNANGQKVYHLNLNIVVEVGAGPHADWLGYQTRTNPVQPGPVFSVPRNSLVEVDIHNFDSATALRNPFFTQVSGTVGNVEYVNGKKVSVMSPDLTSHTFTIPSFGVSVPMEGVPDNAAPTKYQDMRFTFRTPNTKGVYRWQCFVPCGSGTYGNGGPMGEIGYMMGLITLT